MRKIVQLATLLLSPAAVLAAQTADAPSMTGLWKTDSAVMGQPVRMMCALTETKNNLSGVCSGAQDGYAVHKIAGTVKGQKVQFYFQAVWGGNSLTTIVSGTLNQDRTRIDGDMNVQPMGGGMDAGPTDMSGALTAVRELEHDTAAVQAVAAAAPTDAAAAQAWAAEARAEMAGGTVAVAKADAADAGAIAAQAGGEAAPSPTLQPVVAGTWKIDGDVQGTPVKMTCLLTQAEHRLTGTCTGAGDDTTPRALAGMTMERGLGWRFDSEYQGQPIAITMRATLTADGKMNGTMTVAPMNAEGTFVAVKQ
jgi:hypothetical protein